MTRNPTTVSPETTIREAAERMASLNVGIMRVTEDQHVVGVIADRDITIRATAKGLGPDTTPVREVMSSDLACCYEDDDVEICIKMMQERRVRRLPVIDHQERLIGIVTIGDLAVHEAIGERTRELLREVSEPIGPRR